MCGIAGYLSKKDIPSEDKDDVLRKMLNKLKHRGPDHLKEFHPSVYVHLGYTRFVINDSQKGNQPFFNEDKKIGCFFNGEIYNYRELKEWLNSRGHKLKSGCDGEVLPHLYEEDGLDFTKKLEGMFAIAIADFRNHKLVLARDRMGEKPLYYSINSRSFLFASSIQPILASNMVSKDLDLQSIAEFFTFRYVPHTNTLIKSIKRLEPASTLILNYETWKISNKVYWKPEMTQPQMISEEKATEELQELLLNSVKLRTETYSNVRIGSSLSGGIDSSAITRLYKSFLKKRSFHSLSVHVKDDPEDLNAIKKVVRKVKTKHHWIDCNTEDIRLLPNIVSLMGDPISAGMIIPSYQCYKEARNKNVRVILTGDGSDELFAGYSGRLIMDGIIKKWDTLDARVRNAYLKEMPSLAEKLKSKLGNPSLSVLERYVAWDDDNCFDLHVREKLLQGTQLAKLDPLIKIRGLEQLTAGVPHENAMLYLELRLRLEGFMLVIQDRTSMACPVECRAPYLDSQIVEFAFKVSPTLKFSRGIEKYILRKAMKETKLLPKEILWRKKHPFSGPISTWMNKLPPNLEFLLTSKVLDKYNFVNSKYVSQIYKAYKISNLDRKTRIKYSDLLFAVLVLTLWLEIFIQNRPVEEFVN